MRKKIAAILSAIILAGVLGWGLYQYRSRQQLENMLNARYQQAFFNLVGHVEQGEVLLAKSLLTNSPENQVQLLSDIWYETNAAQADLHQLPISQPILAQSSKFLTQIGAYSKSLIGQTVTGKPLTVAQLDKLTAFHNNATALLDSLQKIRVNISQGALNWIDIRKESRGNLPEGQATPEEDSFRNINQELENQPVLIYDGPFSDHLNLMQPKGLTGKQITLAEAKKIFLNFADIDKKGQWRIQELKNSHPVGKIPAFSLKLINGNTKITADISRKGGHVVWMTVERNFGRPQLPPEKVKQFALDFMKKRGFLHLTPSFFKINRHSATVALVPVEKNILIYPDQIKLEVALDNGQVIGYEALGYLMAHHQRNFPEVLVSKDEAKKLLNSQLSIRKSRLALIPLSSGKEALAWELQTEYNRDIFFVYINALSGKEEKILQIFTNDNGQLAL